MRYSWKLHTGKIDLSGGIRGWGSAALETVEKWEWKRRDSSWHLVTVRGHHLVETGRRQETSLETQWVQNSGFFVYPLPFTVRSGCYLPVVLTPAITCNILSNTLKIITLINFLQYFFWGGGTGHKCYMIIFNLFYLLDNSEESSISMDWILFYKFFLTILFRRRNLRWKLKARSS